MFTSWLRFKNRRVVTRGYDVEGAMKGTWMTSLRSVNRTDQFSGEETLPFSGLGPWSSFRLFLATGWIRPPLHGNSLQYLSQKDFFKFIPRMKQPPSPPPPTPKTDSDPQSMAYSPATGNLLLFVYSQNWISFNHVIWGSFLLFVRELT